MYAYLSICIDMCTWLADDLNRRPETANEMAQKLQMQNSKIAKAGLFDKAGDMWVSTR